MLIEMLQVGTADMRFASAPIDLQGVEKIRLASFDGGTNIGGDDEAAALRRRALRRSRGSRPHYGAGAGLVATTPSFGLRCRGRFSDVLRCVQLSRKASR